MQKSAKECDILGGQVGVGRGQTRVEAGSGWWWSGSAIVKWSNPFLTNFSPVSSCYTLTLSHSHADPHTRTHMCSSGFLYRVYVCVCVTHHTMCSHMCIYAYMRCSGVLCGIVLTRRARSSILLMCIR